jgi:protocatechuate 3,4-dioxygenase beta subunit
VTDRANTDHRAALHTRHASSRSRRTPYVAHRPGIDEWLRRQLLAERAWTRRSVLGGLGAVSLAACSGGGSGSTGMTAGTGGATSGTGGTASGTTTGAPSETITSTTPGTCVLIPEETQGPYPLFNDIASAAMYQREDITEGKPGVPVKLTLNVVDMSRSCAPVTTAMVYVWHCDKDGVYSGYSQPGADARGQTFLRGVQTTDTNGQVTFATIFPGWYQGRATHIHFRVYLALDLHATSQLAFPTDVETAVYGSALYAARGQNPTSPSKDGIFADGVQYQVPTVMADASTGGYVATLMVGIT